LEQVDEASFYRVLVLSNENRKIIKKIKAKNVKELKFTDLKGQDRTYVNNGRALKELMYDGKKIKWYRAIYQHIYDGSIQYLDYLVAEDKQEFRMGLFSNYSKKITEATKSKPELANEIKNMKMTEENILYILQKYDQ
jgi:hypothetical protein